MGVFPKKESEIVELAEKMIAGFMANPDDFPSGEPEIIEGRLTAYKQMRDSATQAQSGAKNAVMTKDEELDKLIELMKNSLKKAEADVSSDPEKLSEIGWSARQSPQPVPMPGAPSNLRSIAEGQGTLFVCWTRSPSGGALGPVRNYIIERRQQLQSGGFSEWTVVGSTYNCELNLTEQPPDIRLEYRVRASNTTGESAPSNSISVTLP